MKNNLNDPFIKAMHNRFACKKYLNKPIESNILEAILEVGRLSPTSFGLEDGPSMWYRIPPYAESSLVLALTRNRGYSPCHPCHCQP